MGRPIQEQIPQQVQRKIIEHVVVPKKTTPSVEVKEDNIAVNLLKSGIDSGAAWWILGFAAVGAFIAVPKLIKKWLN